jgi:hypothetical protein
LRSDSGTSGNPDRKAFNIEEQEEKYGHKDQDKVHIKLVR